MIGSSGQTRLTCRFSQRRQTLPGARSILKSSLELCDQAREGFGLLIRGKVTAGQPLDLKAEPTKAFFREVDLSVLKGVIIAAAHQERELTAISLEKAAEVE